MAESDLIESVAYALFRQRYVGLDLQYREAMKARHYQFYGEETSLPATEEHRIAAEFCTMMDAHRNYRLKHDSDPQVPAEG